ncbi:hypothetical protein TVAG_052150 [Trichomonas vaginalis G3]|uniref:receptor protein-tyrosine kinase n=1 Tax=Trichomonas vaginalis (strain ATCC PRA-98 / G3) TaxID=412133 RepID=A2F4L1_TRIV3|nr:glycine-rich protein family [Trichomonas vaginalis G3]EAY00167.1 hypothetical protein TVAG_052150 [Trichomonas vaginalis G3]KAI5541132.1 glycine-rich protein family [Trichomonas vaginalis G3]|eukprot:XP_001313096.1 hypothetical protein [Trichomonas vaginalis G3]
MSLLDSDRIAVAGGGGGCGRVGNGGHAGGMTGGNGIIFADNDPGWCGKGESQISGGKVGSYYDGFTTHLGKDGELKRGGDGYGQGFNAGGGGGGFYGGGGSYESGGGGGSSYLNPVLYGSILSGSESFKSPEGTLETGHYGDGFVQITPMYYTCLAHTYMQLHFLFTLISLGFS